VVDIDYRKITILFFIVSTKELWVENDFTLTLVLFPINPMIVNFLLD